MARTSQINHLTSGSSGRILTRKAYFFHLARDVLRATASLGRPQIRTAQATTQGELDEAISVDVHRDRRDRRAGAGGRARAQGPPRQEAPQDPPCQGSSR